MLSDETEAREGVEDQTLVSIVLICFKSRHSQRQAGWIPWEKEQEQLSHIICFTEGSV